jgi:hypothetical protein
VSIEKGNASEILKAHLHINKATAMRIPAEKLEVI